MALIWCNMQLTNNSKITVYGIPFLGVEELVYRFLEGKPKEGIYVGGERKAYPCFDSEDWQYENRFYWNFVFARDLEELKAKVERLRAMEGRYSCRKLCSDLGPMVYWEGDAHHLMETNGSEDIVYVPFRGRVERFVPPEKPREHIPKRDCPKSEKAKRAVEETPRPLSRMDRLMAELRKDYLMSKYGSDE
ncbi:hypothetical protein [uncultured Parabacteroides sp.]|uniref:hypothetical protein n=1 Tax=uncultured Parabacteroides sp. TaxID=512312 RepID=UPI00261F43C9|nr:hypothetical protein [uncultured Parabacteroides sp.]